jgi:hypothetical protein
MAVAQAGQDGLAGAVHDLIAVKPGADRNHPAGLYGHIRWRRRCTGAIEDSPASEYRPRSRHRGISNEVTAGTLRGRSGWNNMIEAIVRIGFPD